MRRLSRPLVMLAGLLGGPLPLLGQELGLVAVGAASDNVEFPDARGFGAFGQLRSAGWLFRLSYVRFADDTRKRGTVCQVYSPRIGCRTEGVATSARMSGLRLGVQHALPLGRRVEVAAGGGLSFNQLDVESQGESGFRADLHLPHTGQIGYLGSASVALLPVPSVPVRLAAVVGGHWVKFRGCVSAEDKTSGYAPFCGWSRFTEVQLGASVTVPRR